MSQYPRGWDWWVAFVVIPLWITVGPAALFVAYLVTR